MVSLLSGKKLVSVTGAVQVFREQFPPPNSFLNCKSCLAPLRPSLGFVHGRFGCSLFKEDDHVVVDVEADVAVGLVLHGEAAAQDDQAVPRLAEFVIELCLDVLSDI